MVGRECPAWHLPPPPLVLAAGALRPAAAAALGKGLQNSLLWKYNQGEISILAGCAVSPRG